jgi:hypothetical protein
VRLIPIATAAFIIALAIACGDDYTEATSTPSDAGGGDSAPGDGGSSIDGAATVSLLTNGDFERGCTGWSTTSALANDETSVHGGKVACKVCSDLATPGGLFQIHQRITIPAVAGARYLVEAFIRAPENDSYAGDTSLRLSFTNAQGAEVLFDRGNVVQLTPEWTRTGAVLDAPSTAVELDVRVSSVGERGQCFVVDDAVLERVQ